MNGRNEESEREGKTQGVQHWRKALALHNCTGSFARRKILAGKKTGEECLARAGVIK